jgi:hypothetical protein
MTGTCREVLAVLDALVDDELDDDRARAAREHLGVCPECRAQEEATRLLVEAARSLPPVEPPASLLDATFQRVAALEAEEASRPPLWWWWRAWRRTVLVGGLATCAVALFALSLARRSGEPRLAPPAAAPVIAEIAEPDLYLEAIRGVARADQDYARAVADLRQIALRERPRWRPEVAHAFDQNLAAIDAAVQRQREVARRDPGDFAAQDALIAAYAKEIDFLEEAVVRGEVEPERERR